MKNKLTFRKIYIITNVIIFDFNKKSKCFLLFKLFVSFYFFLLINNWFYRLNVKYNINGGLDVSKGGLE